MRALSWALPSHNGAPLECADAKSSRSHGALQISLASRRLFASNVTVGLPPISTVKTEGKSVGVMFPLPFRRLPAPIATLSSVRDFRETPFVPFHARLRLSRSWPARILSGPLVRLA